MDVQTCIDKYKRLAEEVFKPRKRTRIGGASLHKLIGNATFSASKLENAVKEILSTVHPPLDSFSMMLEADGNPLCKVYVYVCLRLSHR